MVYGRSDRLTPQVLSPASDRPLSVPFCEAAAVGMAGFAGNQQSRVGVCLDGAAAVRTLAQARLDANGFHALIGAGRTWGRQRFTVRSSVVRWARAALLDVKAAQGPGPLPGVAQRMADEAVVREPRGHVMDPYRQRAVDHEQVACLGQQ
jgi:hypothetical protein